ncbi:MAG TPA: hypothetical protein VKZ63_06830 [Kofleriaceae bacterium]|nr:hypothetical protein [Kofleriaceae bacterium]
MPRPGSSTRPALALAAVLVLASGCALETEVWDPIPDPPSPDQDGLRLEWPEDTPLPPEFESPPWLTMPAPDRISVGWLTVAQETGRVELVQIAGPGGSAPPDPFEATYRQEQPARIHQIDLGVLPVASGFRYRVVLDGSGATREGVFVTPGQPRWRFVHLAEFHAPTESDEVARFAGAIREFGPHLVIESGDMMNDGGDPTQWLDYLRTSSPWISNVILLPAHSNHVNGTLGNPYLKAYFHLPNNERWYTTRYGEVEIVTLDSTYGSSPDIEGQGDWVRQSMDAVRHEANAPRFVVGVWHYPACSSHYPGRTESRRWVIDTFLPAFMETGGVDLVLVGHDKYYERSVLEVGGREVVHVMANVGRLSPSSEGDNEPECTPVMTHTDTRSLVMARVEPGHLQAQVIDQEGMVIDTFDIVR